MTTDDVDASRETDQTPDADRPRAADGDARRRTFALIGAGLAAFLLIVVGIVALAGRGSSIVTTVDAAEAIPAPTPPPTETIATTTTTEAAPADAPPPTEAPAEAPPPTELSPEAPINIPHPSTVLTGRTQGNIPVYANPGGGVKLTLPNPRAINGDPKATVPLVLLARQLAGDWIEAYIPVRPNGSTGWVRRSDFTISTHDYRIEVRLGQFNLKVFNGDKLIMNTGIGVATASSPTPGGLYYTTELLAPPDPNGPYGPYAYGLSGFSNTYTSFGGGPGQLGLHGTNQPGAIGQRVSHGCIRLRNQDITTLAKTLPLGVPVLVYR